MSKNIKKTASKPEKTDFTAIKKLLRYSKPYLGIILAALFCALVQITATLLGARDYRADGRLYNRR